MLREFPSNPMHSSGNGNFPPGLKDNEKVDHTHGHTYSQSPFWLFADSKIVNSREMF